MSRSTRIAGGFSVFVLVNGAISPLIGWITGRMGAQRIILMGAGALGIGLSLGNRRYNQCDIDINLHELLQISAA